eukprot:TRINITY_DN37194_c0_g1_i1.p1 TRINITY_DN37194_c0_g1~~TRINITY_DN37194_c0_g1_i1.p1  ORF type:complete len:249 (+),score=65.64 TRINITY_DN37194_c0_g1_i1:1-747(+)
MQYEIVLLEHDLLRGVSYIFQNLAEPRDDHAESIETIRTLSQSTNVLDMDGDGQVTIKELEELDINKDGKLDIKEYMTAKQINIFEHSKRAVASTIAMLTFLESKLVDSTYQERHILDKLKAEWVESEETCDASLSKTSELLEDLEDAVEGRAMMWTEETTQALVAVITELNSVRVLSKTVLDLCVRFLHWRLGFLQAQKRTWLALAHLGALGQAFEKLVGRPEGLGRRESTSVAKERTEVILQEADD